MSNITRNQSRNEVLQGRDNQDLTSTERFVTPRASVFEAQDFVVLELEMPGVTRDTIDITLERDELTVTGRRKVNEYANLEIVHQERLQENFRRSFVLSEKIDGSKIAAKYEDGVLRLTLPKSEDLKPRKITID